MGDISPSDRGFDKAVPNDTPCPPNAARVCIHPWIRERVPAPPGLQGEQHKHGGIWVLPLVTPRPQSNQEGSVSRQAMRHQDVSNL